MTAQDYATPEETKAIAKDFRDYAEHFVQRDWAYTRDLGPLHSIRYAEDTPWERVKDAFGWLLSRKNHGIYQITGGDNLRNRLTMFWYSLKPEDNLPDGVLDGGGIITFWEETGEYIQYVQPSVGSLIADFLAEDSSNPFAQRIAAEMKRIQIDYALRLSQKLTDDN